MPDTNDVSIESVTYTPAYAVVTTKHFINIPRPTQDDILAENQSLRERAKLLETQLHDFGLHQSQMIAKHKGAIDRLTQEVEKLKIQVETEQKTAMNMSNIAAERFEQITRIVEDRNHFRDLHSATMAKLSKIERALKG